jgi:hypothetical protein
VQLVLDVSTRCGGARRRVRTASSTRCASGFIARSLSALNRLDARGRGRRRRRSPRCRDELVDRSKGGHQIGPDTVGAVPRRARSGRRRARRIRRRRLAPSWQEHHAEDGEPETLRRRDPRGDR